MQAAYKAKEEIELQHEERGEILVQPRQHANVWFIYWFMRRNLMMFIETLPTQKPCFFSHQSPAETKHSRRDWEWFLWATADQRWPYCRLSYCAASGLGLRRGPVCLDSVNNAPYYCSGHCALFDTQSNCLSPIPVQSASKHIFWQIWSSCAHNKSCLVYSISFRSSVHWRTERRCYLLPFGTIASLNSSK